MIDRTLDQLVLEPPLNARADLLGAENQDQWEAAGHAASRDHEHRQPGCGVFLPAAEDDLHGRVQRPDFDLRRVGRHGPQRREQRPGLERLNHHNMRTAHAPIPPLLGPAGTDVLSANGHP
jgi:hypothetical protein